MADLEVKFEKFGMWDSDKDSFCLFANHKGVQVACYVTRERLGAEHETTSQAIKIFNAKYREFVEEMTGRVIDAVKMGYNEVVLLKDD